MDGALIDTHGLPTAIAVGALSGLTLVGLFIVVACCRTAATRVRAGLGAAAVAGALFGLYWAYDAVLTI